MSGQEFGISLEENLKKALTELLILQLLSKKESYIGELTAALAEKSGGVLSIVFPYGAIYRLEQGGHIEECGKRSAPDGRRRQYIRITEKGTAHLRQLRAIYTRFSDGVTAVLEEGDTEDGIGKKV